MRDYRYDQGHFIIENYDQQKPFASFLPGISGVNGIPLWVYYTNRGQGIAGFGVENKHGAIMDFVPANMAYKRTELHGFRTFIKMDGRVHEIFSSIAEDSVQRRMTIEYNAFTLEEINETLGIQVVVKYTTATDVPYAGLIRSVAITNRDQRPKQLEIVDGLMTLWPYRNDDAVIKSMSNLAVAWFEAYNTENHMPFFKNRSTTQDSAAVGTVEAGHFYAAYSNDQLAPLPVIVDPDLLFGNHTSLIKPVAFTKSSLSDILQRQQASENKIPCAFSAFEGTLKNSVAITSVIGRAASLAALKAIAKDFSSDYFHQMMKRAQDITAELLSDVETRTAFPIFDAYIKQCYLDNLLRGGYPLVFEGREAPIVYHVYSRIHGDMEREYNDFYVEPAYYSHGNGNFRDVNQNRRSDIYFVREAGLYNVRQFMDLIQLDGHNPLVIKGSKLNVTEEGAEELLRYALKGAEHLATQLQQPFSPGDIMTALDAYPIELSVSREQFLKAVMRQSIQENQAAYGHGFWVDHWTYNMDLIDNYLNIFPDMLEDLLYKVPFKYFRSPEAVLPRHLKYVLTKEGKVRQYDAVYRDVERLSGEGFDGSATNWHTDVNHHVIQTNLVVKLLILALTKITNFDPSGLGLMMNSDKPGWNDAMNGLPGLFGSGISEVIEVQRIVGFLIKSLLRAPNTLELPEEVYELLDAYTALLQQRLADKMEETVFWQAVQEARERYISRVSRPISGVNITLPCEVAIDSLESMAQKIADALNRAQELGCGILPSYLVHEAVRYDVNPGVVNPNNGLPTVTVQEWTCRQLPRYLEAPARYLKQLSCREEASRLYQSIKESTLYDQQLKMYVTSESLEEETLEIGRARAFTAGWLEREAVFMHMSYKYLLGLLKAGLYDVFYSEIETALPPFMDPKVYGRSTLENSSFIASSRNPNPEYHGRGFVSRLTGTTSEMISMWLHMMTGSKIFKDEGQLTFTLAPVLRQDYFDENNQVAFKLFRRIQVIYTNPKRKSTFGGDGVKPMHYELCYKDGTRSNHSVVVGEAARAIREGRIDQINVLLD